VPAPPSRLFKRKHHSARCIGCFVETQRVSNCDCIREMQTFATQRKSPGLRRFRVRSTGQDYLALFNCLSLHVPQIYTVTWSYSVLIGRSHGKLGHPEGALLGAGARHPSDNGRVQSSRPLDVTNSTQQGRQAAAMRTIATITSTTCFTHRKY